MIDEGVHVETLKALPTLSTPVAALGVGVLNSIRLTFMPTTLWALATYIVMIAAGGGLIFRSFSDYDDKTGNGEG